MKAKYVIRIIAFFLVTIALVFLCADIMQVNNGRDVVGMYGLDLESENSIDVALIGPSQVYTSYYAPMAYKEFGYTSFAVSTSAMSGALYKYAVQEMLERQNPQLFIIEISGFYYSVQTDEAVMRKYLDNIPTYSSSRLEAIQSLVPEEERLSFYIPFIKYHNNLQNIKTCLQVYVDKIKIKARGYSRFKNFSTTNGIFDTTLPGVEKATRNEMSDEALLYLDDLLEYLKEKDIKNVVFANFPDEFRRKGTDSYRAAVKKIKDAGFVYKNFYEQRHDIGIDPKTDYYNVGHLNINGAVKMTHFLGEFITENYDIKSNHTDEVKAQWDDCACEVDTVIEMARARLKKVKDPSKLMQAYVENSFYYEPENEIYEDEDEAA